MGKFLYSNLNGLEHMKQVLESSPLFFNLLTPKDIFNKICDVISSYFFTNKYSGVVACEWSGRNVCIALDDKEKFFNLFDTWIAQLEQFVGRENLFNFSMEQNELDGLEDLPSDIEQNIYFINFLESYRLKFNLTNSLPKKNFIQKNKI